MPDEEEQLINLDDEVKPSRPDTRFKDLSEKVENTAKERDQAKADAEKAKKDAEFYKGFSTVASKQQHAGEYQDAIKKKVDSGYELEDAMTSVLVKEGKWVAPIQEVQRESPAGGSASTAMTSPDDKPISEMTTAEKKQRLLEMEAADPGSLSQTLRNINV